MTAFESSAPNVWLAAIEWLTATLLGPAATALAVIAVATAGLMMLRGRVPVGHAAQVLLGCFILFGAGSIAAELRGVAEGAGGRRFSRHRSIPHRPKRRWGVVCPTTPMPAQRCDMRSRRRKSED